MTVRIGNKMLSNFKDAAEAHACIASKSNTFKIADDQVPPLMFHL